MEIIREILLEAVEIMTLVFGILGMTFSLLLLFSPNVARNLSNLINRNVDIEKKLTFLDKDIRTDMVIYDHNILIGTCLLLGSIFALIFFFFKLDISNFAKIFLGSQSQTIGGEIFFQTISWVGKISCFLGLAAGLLLLVAPTKMRKFETVVNAWFETKSMVEKWDRSSKNIDTFLFQHPIFFGLIGGAISLLLIVLSILNLLD
jgi:hypothetical protein